MAPPLSHRRVDLIAAVCDAISDGHRDEAIGLLQDAYTISTAVNPPPAFSRQPPAAVYGTGVGRTNFTKPQQIAVFHRDGFLDRYTGYRLVFPGVLRLLSLVLLREFPWHPNWKMGECHPAYWDLQPTVDHIVPITRGGDHGFENWVTTNMTNNQAKGNHLLNEIGWELLPADNSGKWDGLASWFSGYISRHPDILQDGPVRQWYTVIPGVGPINRSPAAPQVVSRAQPTMVGGEHWHVHAHQGDGAGPRNHSTGTRPHSHPHVHPLDPAGIRNSHYHAHSFKLADGPAKMFSQAEASKLVESGQEGNLWRRALL